MKSARKYILLAYLVTSWAFSHGQIGVDNVDPDPSSILDLNSTTKGLLIPRMTSAQREAITDPANSLLVFDTTLGLYYYHMNSQWYPLNPWLPSVSGSGVYFPGDVGIGTDNPLSRLHILNSTHINFLIDRTDTEDFVTLMNGSGGSGIKFSNSNFFFISTDIYANRNAGSVGTELFRINSDGKIGIGTHSPAYKVDVNGSLNASALYVNGVPVSTSASPTGVIVMWHGALANIPAGWALCDGANGTPDLRERFIVGAGGNNLSVPGGLTHTSGYNVNDTGGSHSVTLTIAQIPSHRHQTGGVGGIDNNANGGGLGDTNKSTSTYTYTRYEGGGQAHENRPAFYALAFIMKL